MRRVIIDMSPSIDGYIAGDGETVERPFGAAGDRLHRWIGLDGGEPTAVDEACSAEMFANTGAFVLGRRMFDVGIDKWGEDGAFGAPCFVVTNRPHEELARGATTFTFVTDGVATAVELAKRAAGDKDVVIAGGATVAQQCLAADLVDELRLHVVPVLLGSGVPLFEAGSHRRDLDLRRAVSSDNAMHLTLEVVR